LHFPPYPVVSSPFWDVLTFYAIHYIAGGRLLQDIRNQRNGQNQE
jgi:hypothetical protein